MKGAISSESREKMQKDEESSDETKAANRKRNDWQALMEELGN